MPRDDKDETSSAGAAGTLTTKRTDPAPPLGRTFKGETSPPITTPEAVAAGQARAAEHAGKAGAVALEVYFVARGHSNPILQASMRAFTDVRAATLEDFDEIFAPHHEAPAPKPAEEIKRP
jgi:hypothetical protein